MPLGSLQLSSALWRSSGASSSNGATLQTVEKKFANGDTYNGSWAKGLPEGEGMYRWSDGSEYEGTWLAGQKHGVGRYAWPTGAVFKGEWSNGCMHGVGTLEGPDGSSYQGGWQDDLKHGLGRKLYANGDCYEGLWKQGKPHGPGRYRWKNRNEYDGEWKSGRMHGQGTLKWATGERYDGEWNAGEEDGLGIFTWTDGSTYDGFWCRSKKHGLGVYRPCMSDFRRTTGSTDGSGIASTRGVAAVRESEQAESGDARRGSSGEAPLPTPSLRGPVDAAMPGGGFDRSASSSGRFPDVYFVREYEMGILIREHPVSVDQIEAVLGPLKERLGSKRPVRRRLKKGGKKSGDTSRAGEKIYKGHRSYDLMLNLQLGIRYSVGRITPEHCPDKLDSTHFGAKVKQLFPRDGSTTTPPHPSNNFKWKDYSPATFRKLREAFGIDAADYMLSICGDQALRELPSPGKSGSVFFISHDERFFIKTMRTGEVKVLMALLPRYYAHVEKYPHTLLIKFYGLHRLTPANGQKVRFVVMNNLFHTGLAIHRKYDLKGSTKGRFSGKPPGPDTVLKDLDLDIQLKLEEGWHSRLMMQVAADCALLEELKVMDYSLLLGVHYRSGGYRSTPLATDKEDDGNGEEAGDTPVETLDDARSLFKDAEPFAVAPLAGSASDSAALPSLTSSSRKFKRPNLRTLVSFKSEDLQSSKGLDPAPLGLTGSLRGLKCLAAPGGARSSGSSRPATPSAAGEGSGGALQDGVVGAVLNGETSDAEHAAGFLHVQEAELRRRLSRNLGDKMSEQAIEDLMTLARFRMLGCRDPARSFRSPTTVLAMRPQRTETLRPAAGGNGGTDELSHSLGQPRVFLGMNMAATAIPQPGADERDVLPANGQGVEDVVLYFGIIDILQEYNYRKRVEHSMKAAIHDGAAISAVNPRHYSHRFKAFLERVFL